MAVDNKIPVKAIQILDSSRNVINSFGGGGGGDVVGPGASTDSHVVLFDGVTGLLIKDSGVLLPVVSDVAYNAGTWNGNLDAPSKNAVRDKIETLTGTGDVVGPGVAVDSNIVLFDTTTGKLIKDSGSSLSSYATIGLAAGLAIALG